MTGFAIETAVPARKAKERFAGRRCIRIRGERVIWGYAHMSRRVEDGCEPDLTTVVRRRTRMTCLAIRFVKPASPAGCTHRAHRAVTALALHRHCSVRRDRAAHGPSQTASG